MSSKSLDDYMVKSAAAALVTADQFIRTLEELRKGGEAVKYSGRPQKTIIESPVAIVTVDGQSLSELIRQPSDRPDNTRYEIVLGVPSELVRKEEVEHFRYIDYVYFGDGEFAKEGSLTGWRFSGSDLTYLLAFGGRVHTEGAYIIHFIPADFSVPASHSSTVIQRSLKANKDFGGEFAAPETFRDKTLARVARGLAKCFKQGVAFEPKVQLQPYNRSSVTIDSIGELYTADVYVLSNKAHSKLEKICRQGLERL